MLTKEQELEIKKELYSNEEVANSLVMGSVDPIYFRFSSSEKCSDGYHIGYTLIDNPVFNGVPMEKLSSPEDSLRYGVAGCLRYLLESKFSYLEHCSTDDLYILCNVLKKSSTEYIVIV